MAGLVLALALAAQSVATPPAQVRLYHDVTLAPQGDRIASVEADDPLDSEREPHETVVVRSRTTGEVVARFDPCAACFYSGLAWSPDGAALAFVASNRKARTAGLMIVRDGKAATALDFAGLLATPRWSPDGKTLAVLATDRPRKLTGATQAGAAIVGEIGHETDEQRIAVLPAPAAGGAAGPLRFLSPPDTFVYEYDWTPDGKGFAVS